MVSPDTKMYVLICCFNKHFYLSRPTELFCDVAIYLQFCGHTSWRFYPSLFGTLTFSTSVLIEPQTCSVKLREQRENLIFLQKSERSSAIIIQPRIKRAKKTSDLTGFLCLLAFPHICSFVCLSGRRLLLFCFVRSIPSGGVCSRFLNLGNCTRQRCAERRATT